MFVATIIAEHLSKLQVDDACYALEHAAGAKPDWNWHWLDEGAAADIPFALTFHINYSLDELRRELPGIDIVVQPAADRAKRLLVADMDSTMITVECIDELADFAGIKPQIAAITERAMRGELDFAAALDARVALLAGLEEGAIDRCLAERVKIMPGARELVRTMRARGGYTVLVSGGFTRFAQPVAEMIGFDRVVANRLEIADGRLTGRVAKPIVDAATKRETLLAEQARLNIFAAATVAVGDGANDLDMIRLAGLGVAYHAKPMVAEAAAARIDHGDLTALLYAQGVPATEWAR